VKDQLYVASNSKRLPGVDVAQAQLQSKDSHVRSLAKQKAPLVLEPHSTSNKSPPCAKGGWIAVGETGGLSAFTADLLNLQNDR